MRTNLKQEYDFSQGSPQWGGEKAPVAAFSAAMTIRLCLLLTTQRGPGQGPERGASAQ